MADLSEYLKQGLKGILKNKQPNRLEKKKLDRKEHRTDMLNARRHIQDSPLPPTPAQIAKGPQKPSRLEILKEWKQKRDQLKLEENSKKKPIFKVCRVEIPTDAGEIYKELKGKPLSKAKKPQSPLKFVGSSHKFIPPKNIKPIQFKEANNKKENGPSETGRVTRSKSQQSSNPARKLNFNSDKENKSDRILRNNVQKSKSSSNEQLSSKENLHSEVKKKLSRNKLKPATNNQLSNKENVNDGIKKKMPPKKGKAAKETKSKKINHGLPEQNHDIKKEEPDCTNSEKTDCDLMIDVNISKNDVNESTNRRNIQSNKTESTSSSLSTEYPIVDVVDTTGNESTVFIENSVTPKSTVKNEFIYVSPFVTMSRGKNEARAEYKSRKSRGGLSLESPEATGSKAGAEYFYKALEDEISRINGVCNEWTNYKDETNSPEEVCDMINVAIGQSNLLISKRMQQFRGLIDSCRAQNTDPLITCGDLHGFWDLLLIQVGNLNCRFENLNKLRANNWEEILPEKKLPTKKKQVTKKTKPKPSSALREAIKAARAKKHVDILTVPNVFDGGFFKVTSPSKSFTSNKTPAKTRKSLLQNVLTAQVSKRLSSPGLTMMKASQTAKIIDTPAKSILKPMNSKSTGKKSKAVFFKEEMVDAELVEEIVASLSSTTIDAEKSNIPNILNSENKKGNVRRSTRLTRNKLF